MGTWKRDTAPSCNCKTGFFEVPEDKICKGCTYPCIACNSPTQCTDCDNTNTGLYLGTLIYINIYHNFSDSRTKN